MKSKGNKIYVYSADNEKISVEEIEFETRKDIVNQMKERRIELGLSKTDLAKRMDVARPSVYRFENYSNSPSLDVLVRFATAMDMKLEVKLVAKD